MIEMKYRIIKLFVVIKVCTVCANNYNDSSISEATDDATTERSKINDKNDVQKDKQFTYAEDKNFEVMGDMIVENGALESPASDIVFRSFHAGVGKWLMDNGYPTVIYDIQDDELKAKSYSAMRAWERETCVRFRQATAEEIKRKSYVKFVLKDNVCRAVLGRLRRYLNIFTGSYSPPQTIEVSDKACLLSSFIHELGHTMGLIHIQMRSDRNQNMFLLRKNIISEKLSQFNTLNNDVDLSYNFPYDYTSILHYDETMFSKNGGITLGARNPYHQILLGIEKNKPSFFDFALVNHHYDCADIWIKKCGKSVKCENLGYMGPQCRCKCPPGTSGVRCQHKAPSDVFEYYYRHLKPSCIHKVTKDNTRISSPNFPSRIKEGTICVYEITAPSADKRISIKFTYADFIAGQAVAHRCFFDHLLIMEDGVEDVQIFCGSDIKRNQVFNFRSKKVFLILRTKTYYSIGFEAIVTFPRN